MPPGSAADGQQSPPVRAAARRLRRSRSPDAKIRNEKDLEKFQTIFADTAFWKKLGEEYQNPLIVTGTVLFTPHADVRLRHDRSAKPTTSSAAAASCRSRTFMERKGFILRPKFIFIDGRTGATLLHRDVQRAGPLQRAAEHARAVVLLRADGQAHPELSEHAEHAEDPRHARPAEVGAGAWRRDLTGLRDSALRRSLGEARSPCSAGSARPPFACQTRS